MISGPIKSSIWFQQRQALKVTGNALSDGMSQLCEFITRRRLPSETAQGIFGHRRCKRHPEVGSTNAECKTSIKEFNHPSLNLKDTLTLVR